MIKINRSLVFFLLKFFPAFFLPGLVSFAQDESKSASAHFVLPEFIKGSVMFKTGLVENVLLNYNMITEEMVFEKNEKRLALENLDKIDTIYLGSRKFIPKEKVFYEVLVNDTVSLFVRHKRNIITPGSPAGYGGTTETGSAHSISFLVNSGNIYKLELPSEYRLTDVSQYWIAFGNSSVRITSERQLLKLFPEISGQLKQFITQNKLNIRKQADLQTLITKCNELIQ